jgi:hypothetical protein
MLQLYTIAGTVTDYGSAVGMAGVAVHFTSSALEFDVVTDAGGNFSAQVPAGSWEVFPYVLVDEANGIDASDAAAVLEASVGMVTVPEEMALAGDVSGNGSLSGYDAALIARRGHGDGAPFPATEACGTAWAFMAHPAAVPNQVILQPALSASGCTLGAVTYVPLSGNASGQNFSAVLFGDVDGSWEPGGS